MMAEVLDEQLGLSMILPNTILPSMHIFICAYRTDGFFIAPDGQGLLYVAAKKSGIVAHLPVV